MELYTSKCFAPSHILDPGVHVSKGIFFKTFFSEVGHVEYQIKGTNASLALCTPKTFWAG